MLKNLKLTAGSADEQIRILFTLIGLLTGFIGYCYLEYVSDLVKHGLHFDDLPLQTMPLFFLATFANFFFMSYERRDDAKALALSLVLSALLTAFLYFKIHGIIALDDALRSAAEDDLFRFFVLFWIICQIALPIGISAIQQGWRHPSYEVLHRKAWNLPLLSLSAYFLLGLMWLVLGLCAFMLQLIQIEFYKIITELWFAIPFSAAIYGLGVAIGREKEHTIALVRDLALNLIRTTLPLLAAIMAITTPMFLLTSLIYIHAAPDIGKTVSIVYTSLSVIVIAIVSINAAIAYDQNSASTSRISILSTKTAVVALALAVIVPLSYLLSVIFQYGFTPIRLYGLIATLLLMLYAFTYVHAYYRQGANIPVWFEAMRRHNIWIAYIVLAVAVWLVSPVGNVNAIAAAQQIHRLKSGAVSFEKFDFHALQYDFGVEGKQALEKLGHDSGFARAADVKQKSAEAKTAGRYGASDTPKRPLNALLLPAGTVLPKTLEGHYEFDQCRTAERLCTIIRANLLLNNTGDEYILLRKGVMEARVLYENADQKSWNSRYIRMKGDPGDITQFGLKTLTHKALVVNGQTIDPVEVY